MCLTWIFNADGSKAQRIWNVLVKAGFPDMPTHKSPMIPAKRSHYLTELMDSR